METNAIIDTTCTKTVSGEKWFLNFMECLDDTALNKVQVIPTRKVFKFGDDWLIYSKYKAIIPAKFWVLYSNQNCKRKNTIIVKQIIIKEGWYLHKYQRWQSSNIWSGHKCAYVNKWTLCCWDFLIKAMLLWFKWTLFDIWDWWWQV